MFAEPQVHMRSKCPFCHNAELAAMAQSLGREHSPVECRKCNDEGWIARWVPLSQVTAMIGVSQGMIGSADDRAS